jgi:hypothetical protein
MEDCGKDIELEMVDDGEKERVTEEKERMTTADLHTHRTNQSKSYFIIQLSIRSRTEFRQ